MTGSGLERFMSAQEGTYDQALAQVRRGRKTGHWKWFVFPQIAGLGRSSTAQHYAIRDLDEARSYLADPVLGERLRECTRAVLESGAPSAEAIFGGIDTMKLRSSMTLFEAAAESDSQLFADVLDRYFDGERDPETVRRL